LGAGVDISTIRAWLGHVSIDTTNVYTEVDLESKAHMLTACGSFTAGDAPTRRWRDDPSLMQFLRSRQGHQVMLHSGPCRRAVRVNWWKGIKATRTPKSCGSGRANDGRAVLSRG
jgi:hypothetical protein